MTRRPVALSLTSKFHGEPILEPPEIEEKKSVPSARGSATNNSKAAPVAGPGPGKSKAAVWADEAIIERIRAAWFHTPTTSPERERSFSDFLLQAALARTKAREKKYNEGAEFPRVPAGKIGPGRKS